VSYRNAPRSVFNAKDENVHLKNKTMTHSSIKKAFDLFYATHHIDYDGQRHRYALDGITCAGVSTVSEFRPKDFLTPWAAKEAVKYLADKQEIIKSMTAQEYQSLLSKAKSAFRRKSQAALDVGTRAHQWVEDFIKAEGRRMLEENN
jgi:hypothetical protein